MCFLDELDFDFFGVVDLVYKQPDIKQTGVNNTNKRHSLSQCAIHSLLASCIRSFG